MEKLNIQVFLIFTNWFAFDFKIFKIDVFGKNTLPGS
jgi:hypothetical protein